MTALAENYRSVKLLVDLNLDRFIYALAVIGGLSLGSYVGSAILVELYGR